MFESRSLGAFIGYLSIILMVTSTSLASVQGTVLFRADFENDKGDNTLAKWKPDSDGQIWEIADFPGSGKGLLNTEEGCGVSGNTPLPGTENFSDGIIQLDMSWQDDDSWGIIFRKSEEKKGYLVTFGYNETPAVIVALLDEGCGETGKCNDQTQCENNPDKTLGQKPHGLFEIKDDGKGTGTQDLSVVYTGVIEAKGDSIKVWYHERGKPKGDPVIDIKDNTHKKGQVGVWHESQGNCMIDNVVVRTFDAGTSVDAESKLATSWARIRSAY